MNILHLLRRRLLDTIVIGGLSMLFLMCAWSEVIAWPLLPAEQNDLAGTWERESGASTDFTLTFTERNVRIEPLFKNYPISVTGSAIVYSDHQQQTYRSGSRLARFCSRRAGIRSS